MLLYERIIRKWAFVSKLWLQTKLLDLLMDFEGYILNAFLSAWLDLPPYISWKLKSIKIHLMWLVLSLFSHWWLLMLETPTFNGIRIEFHLMNKSYMSQMHAFEQEHQELERNSIATRYIPEYSVSPSSTCYQQYVRASNYLFAKITFYELNESKIFAVNEKKSSVCIHRSIAKYSYSLFSYSTDNSCNLNLIISHYYAASNFRNIKFSFLQHGKSTSIHSIRKMFHFSFFFW